MHIIPVMAHLSNSHITLKNQKDDKTDNGDQPNKYGDGSIVHG